MMSWRGLFLCLWLGSACLGVAQERGLRGLPEKKWDELSDRNVKAMGRAALLIRPGDWKHAETENFVYHFFNGALSTPASIEAEFYLRFLLKELGKTADAMRGKAHIFLFDKDEDWAAFRHLGQLDPWTGGVHSEGELFCTRKPGAALSNRTLGHEMTHLAFFRIHQRSLPLWLEEGYAEYVSIRSYASYHRARGFRAAPVSRALSDGSLIPLAELTALTAYPVETDARIVVFYGQSEKLVRFLAKTDKPAMLSMIDKLGKGDGFEGALRSAFGARFMSIADLEKEFRVYATKDFGSSFQNTTDED